MTDMDRAGGVEQFLLDVEHFGKWANQPNGPERWYLVPRCRELGEQAAALRAALSREPREEVVGSGGPLAGFWWLAEVPDQSHRYIKDHSGGISGMYTLRALDARRWHTKVECAEWCASANEWLPFKVEAREHGFMEPAHPPASAGAARAEPYVPKVGDRVRYPDGTLYVVKKHNAGSEYPFAVFDLRAGTDNAFMPGYLTYDGPATPAERAAAGVGEEAHDSERRVYRYVVGQVNGAWCVVDAEVSEVVERFQTYEAAYSKALALRCSPVYPTPDAGGVGEAKAAFYEAARTAIESRDGCSDAAWTRAERAMREAHNALLAAEARRGESGEAMGGTL